MQKNLIFFKNKLIKMKKIKNFEDFSNELHYSTSLLT